MTQYLRRYVQINARTISVAISILTLLIGGIASYATTQADIRDHTKQIEELKNSDKSGTKFREEVLQRLSGLEALMKHLVKQHEKQD